MKAVWLRSRSRSSEEVTVKKRETEVLEAGEKDHDGGWSDGPVTKPLLSRWTWSGCKALAGCISFPWWAGPGWGSAVGSRRGRKRRSLITRMEESSGRQLGKQIGRVTSGSAVCYKGYRRRTSDTALSGVSEVAARLSYGRRL